MQDQSAHYHGGLKRAANERNIGGSPIDSQPTFEQDTSQRGSKTIKRAAQSPPNNAQNDRLANAVSSINQPRDSAKADSTQHPVPFLFRQTQMLIGVPA